jgi:phosphatidylserine decarboxylase
VTTPFSAWKEGAKYYGAVFALGFVVLIALAPSVKALYVACPIFAVGLAILFFFRDPQREINAEPDEILSPADGRIVGIEDLQGTPYHNGACTRISIFLSIFDVHINRAPFNGTVRKVEYRPGQFMSAMNPQSGDCNEANTVWMDTSNGPVTVRQVAGIIARRIVCKTSPGSILARGEKFGMIRFGSRTELYLPCDAEVCVSVGDTARAGLTVLARFRKGGLRRTPQ